MRKVIVRINPTGEKVSVEVDGVIGQSCKDITRDLISRLGTTESEKLKNEFYMVEQQKECIHG
jgi:hypothetical protein